MKHVNARRPVPILLAAALAMPAAPAAAQAPQATAHRVIAVCSEHPDITAGFIATFAGENADIAGTVEIVDPAGDEADLSRVDTLVVASLHLESPAMWDCAWNVVQATGTDPAQIMAGIAERDEARARHHEKLPPWITPGYDHYSYQLYLDKLRVAAYSVPEETRGCWAQESLLSIFNTRGRFHDRIPSCAAEVAQP